MAFTLSPASSRTLPFFHLSILRALRVLSTLLKAGWKTLEAVTGAATGAVAGEGAAAWPKSIMGAKAISGINVAREKCVGLVIAVVQTCMDRKRSARYSTPRNRPPLASQDGAPRFSG